jgi:cathepsin D
MAYPALAEKGVKPVFDEMIDQKLLKQNVFAFYLTSKQAEGMGMLSDLTFGYYDKAKFKGDIHWNDIKFKYMFGVKLDDVKIKGESTGLCKDRECLITFDSGTSLMSMPSFAAGKLTSMNIPVGNNMMDCASHTQYGDMTLVIGGKDYVISNEEWMFPAQQLVMAQGQTGLQSMTFKKFGPLGPQMIAEVDSTELPQQPEQSSNIQTEADKIHHGQSSGKGMKCLSTIMQMDIAKSMFLVGDVFMRKYYTIFDRDNNRVGLAEAVTNSKIAALNAKS